MVRPASSDFRKAPQDSSQQLTPRNTPEITNSFISSLKLKRTFGCVLFTNHFQMVNGTFLFKSFRWKILEW